MNLLTIRVPLAGPGIHIPNGDRREREDAALRELFWLIPALEHLPGAIPSLGSEAIGSQQFLSLTIVPCPQLDLDLGRWQHLPDRLIELDSALVDQFVVIESLQLTRELLALAGQGEPQAIQLFRESLERRENGRSANRLRRELGTRYTVDVFGDDEWIQVPLIPNERVDPVARQFCLLVVEMRRDYFKCRCLLEVAKNEGDTIFTPASRRVYSCSRIDAARRSDRGRILQESIDTMESISASGRLVISVLTDDPIALEISDLTRHLP
jgi:hypothetical protein